MPDEVDLPDSGLPGPDLEPALAALAGDGFGLVQHVGSTGSTNADLLQRPMGESPERSALLWTDTQNQGRGRRGRTWVSKPGQALTFSVALERRLSSRSDPVPAPAFSLVAGLVVAEVLDASGLSALPVSLKWPNDVVINDRKVAGILIELRVRGDIQRMVVGCGVNLLAPAPEAIVQASVRALRPGGVLQAGNTTLDGAQGGGDNPPCLTDEFAAQIVADLARAMQAAHRQFFAGGLQDFIGRWTGRHCYQGQTIELMDSEHILSRGRCIGIDDQGALLIENAHGRQAFSIGEVSARPLPDLSSGARA